jgi:hypothetical protein
LAASKPERQPERDRGQGITAVVHQVGQERDAAGEREDDRLDRGGRGQNAEAERHRPEPCARSDDGAVDPTVLVPLGAEVMIVSLMRVRVPSPLSATRRRGARQAQ